MNTHLRFNLLKHGIGLVIVVELACRLEVLGSLLPVAEQDVGLPPPLVALGGVRVELHRFVAVSNRSVGFLKLHISTGGRGGIG